MFKKSKTSKLFNKNTFDLIEHYNSITLPTDETYTVALKTINNPTGTYIISESTYITAAE